MKLLIIGSGGREHALAWKLAQSTQVSEIIVAPGNAGTSRENKCKNVSLTTIPELVDFAKTNQIALTIVGPEALLVDGIADAFEAENLAIFAPNKQCAQLEGSKAFAKEFMKKHGVNTAAYESFTNRTQAINYLQSCNFPIVVKASGLAAGKGVIICETLNDATSAVNEMMQNNKFGEAGSEIVIEEFLEGFEASILSICDGKTIVPFISAKDHKKIGEGETGLNTGGMGVIAPNPQLTETQYQAFISDILQPTLKGLTEEQLNFIGVIFFGLMVNNSGVYLLEYNTRFGDPETQAVLPLLQNDLLPIIQSALQQELSTIQLNWKQEHSCCVVAVSGGYPEQYEKNKLIDIQPLSNAQLFIAGAEEKGDTIVTTGGRVLNVVATAPTRKEAREIAYQQLNSINFEGMVTRSDIGL